MAERNSASLNTSGQKRHWMRWVLEGVALIAVLFALHHYQTRDTVSGQAPEIHGRLLAGTPVSLREFRGRPVLLQFWASWCPICSMQQRSIHSIAQDHAVLSVALGEDSADEIRRWMADKGVAYPVILDPSGQISGRFGVKAVPASLIIDASGRIRFVEVGYTTEIGLRLRLWWAGI